MQVVFGSRVQPVDAVGDVHVGHVPDGDELVEADVPEVGRGVDGDDQGPALGDEGGFPGKGRNGAKEAFILSEFERTPTMFGPRTRVPYPAAIRTSSSSRSLRPTSLKPEVMTISP